MTTWALLGLLVVLLVAIGIAAFLLRGRNRGEDREPTTEKTTGPPRTVRDLVERRRSLAGADDGDAAQRADRGEPDTAEIETDEIATAGAAPDETAAGTATPASGGSPDDATPPCGQDGAPRAEPAGDTGAAVAAADRHEGGDTAGRAADDADPARPTAAPPSFDESDVDTGPVGPPWSRGFVDGVPIEPREPAPEDAGRSSTAGTARPSPHARSASPDTEPDSVDTDSVDTDSVDTDSLDTATDPTGTTRPAAPPRQESRSPVDPDLVKRVTAVPGDRSSAARTTSPDTEREFREARDRISAQPAAGRVPEQAGPFAAGRRPSPTPASERETDEQARGEAEPAATGTAARVGAAALGVGAVAGAVAVAGSAASARPAPAEPDTGRGGPSGADSSAASAGESRAPADAPYVASAGSPPDAGSRERGTSPSPRPGTSVAQEDEPAPRPTPRRMRSTAPVAGADITGTDAEDEPHDADAPAGEPSSTATPASASAMAAPTASASTEPDRPAPTPTIPAAAAPAPAPSPNGAAPTPVSVPGPPDPSRAERGEPAPVVTFSRARSAGPSAAPVPGTGAQDVRVRVTGRDGAALGGIALVLRDGAGAEIDTGTTDADGAARLRAPGAGRYVVVASAEEYQPGVATCSVADDRGDVTLTMTRSAAVHGTVRSAGGDPAAGIAVTLDQDGETVARADTGPDGTFRLADLGAGYYRLTAGDGEGTASGVVRVAAEADVEQDLRLAAR